MQFSDYLKMFQNEDTPIGDLARDFIKSRSRAKTYQGVYNHLEKNHADYNVIKILETLKMEYENNYKEIKNV